MKILTIDFDILMHYDLRFYNNFIQEGWEQLLQNPLMASLKLDIGLYNKLTLLLLKLIKTIDINNIYFILNHSTAYDILNKQNINGYDLYNIDFHHDFGYGFNQIQKNNEPLNCGNWVYKLFINNKIHNYFWLNTTESDKPPQDEYNYEIIDIIDNFEQIQEIKNFDKIIICLSPEWVPPYYQDLFFLWMSLCEEYYNKKLTLYK